MKFISLGRHCDIAHNIKLYNNDHVITNFFDWLRIDFSAVLDILNIGQIEKIFNKQNIIIDKKSYQHESNIGITFKNFETKQLCCLSHHDIKLENYNNEAMNNQLTEFIEKYKRRYNRLMDVIKSNEKIIFIYRGMNFNENLHVPELRKTILKINKNAIFYLVVLVDIPENWIERKKENYLKINVNKLTNKNIKIEWNNPQFNWQEIFNIIKKNIS